MIGVDGVERDHGVTCNRFTANGLQQWASGSLGSNLALGSGSRSEAASGTALEAFVRSASGSWSYTNTNVIDSANGVMRSEAILNVTFPAETVPVIYTELGIWRDSATSLQTYALIRNLAGLPAALSVLAGEQVRVAYRVQYAIPLLHSSVQTMDGVETTVTVVPRRIPSNITSSARLPDYYREHVKAFYGAIMPIPLAGQWQSGGGLLAQNKITLSNGVITIITGESDWQGTGISRLDFTTTFSASGMYYSPEIMIHFDPPLNNVGAAMTLKISTTLTNGEFYGT